MLLSRERYLIIFNYLILGILSLLLIDIKIYNFEYLVGYLIISFIFIYYVFGNIFTLTYNKLSKSYSGRINLRYYLCNDGIHIKRLECCILNHSDKWYDLDMGMFGFIDSKMHIDYYNKHLLSAFDVNSLLKVSDRMLYIRRHRKSYDSCCSDKFQMRFIWCLYYIFFSIIYFILVYR